MKRFNYLIAILLMATNSFAQGHFNVAWSGNGNDQMNIYVITATLDGVDLKVNDEIAVFDGTICCGKAILTKPITLSEVNSFALVIASSLDPGKLNGFTDGNPISYKYWDSSKNIEIPVS